MLSLKFKGSLKQIMIITVWGLRFTRTSGMFTLAQTGLFTSVLKALLAEFALVKGSLYKQ